MTGKRYYVTTLGNWKRYSNWFANSHWFALDLPSGDRVASSPASNSAVAPTVSDASPIIAVVEADEGAHLTLEDHPHFEALPHPLAQKPISERAQSALAMNGVKPGASTYDAAETLARYHPLLRHTVY